MAKIQTTIKIDEDIYGQFKLITTKSHQKLQRVCEKMIWIYTTQEAFRSQIDNISFSTSGSI